MKITLNNIGKRYNYEWIFRSLNYEFNINSKTVILGGNGSGKSTLLQAISSSSIFSEGEITYQIKNKEIEADKIFQRISIAAPYLELFDDFTLSESIDFQKSLKPFTNNISTKEFIETLELTKASNKELKYFSSGMKQRVKLALAILSDTPILLLDEPTSNLDKKAISWYQNLIENHTQNKILIICSNQVEEEYHTCNNQINIEDFKQFSKSN
jgi:ABC-type multidrug transport system ATPase subunit